MDEKDKEIAKLKVDLAKSEADKAKILGEKKDLLEIFNKEDKEGMTDTEKKLAETLEAERAERLKLQDSLAKDAERRTAEDNKRIADEAVRVTKALDERITKVAKGDKAVEDKLRANVALLDKLPRVSDTDLDAVINTSYNMLGTKESNPLNSMSGITGGAPKIEDKTAYSTTPAGVNMAGKLGLEAVVKAGTPTPPKEGEAK